MRLNPSLEQTPTGKTLWLPLSSNVGKYMEVVIQVEATGCALGAARPQGCAECSHVISQTFGVSRKERKLHVALPNIDKHLL